MSSGVTGAGRHGYGLTGDQSIDSYLTGEALDEAPTSLRVRNSPTGAHLLRVVADPAFIADLKAAPRLAVAADLLDHAVAAGAVDGRVVDIIQKLLAELDTAAGLGGRR